MPICYKYYSFFQQKWIYSPFPPAAIFAPMGVVYEVFAPIEDEE